MAKYLDSTGVSTVWSKTKSLVQDSVAPKLDSSTFTAEVTNKLGKASGIATLGTDGKLTSTQLPALKTVNGNSIVGSGNIELDLSLYKVVTTLPTTGIETNKIYLVLKSGAPTGNIYSEYIYYDSKWELLGEYKADVDLTPYVKFTDVATTAKAGAMSAADKTKLDGIAAGANNYTLPIATSTARGGIKIGYTASGKNYPVQLSNEQAYVNVPWTDTTYSAATTTANGLMSSTDKAKLDKVPTTSIVTEIKVPTRGPSAFTFNFSSTSMTSGSNTEGTVGLPLADASYAGMMSAALFTKLNGVATAATADSALTAAEVTALLV